MRGRLRARRAAQVTAAGLAATLVAACAPQSGSQESSSGEGSWPEKSVRVMAPADPGGGWDQTSRAMQKVLGEQTGKRFEVYNVGGAGGTVGLAEFVQKPGEAHELMTMGSIMVGAIETNDSAATLEDVTPLARLLGEWEVIVAPKNSPYQSIEDLVAGMKKDVASVAIAGGSAGGIEQVLAGLVAREAGADPQKVNYIAHSGGGEALATILAGRVDAGISGIAEIIDQIRAGKVKPLAVSSPERIEGIDAPTLKESGLDIELANWRGIVAPPDISPEQEKAIEKELATMAKSDAWQAILEKNGWDDQFQAGEEFEKFLAREEKLTRGVLEDLGLVES